MPSSQTLSRVDAVGQAERDAAARNAGGWLVCLGEVAQAVAGNLVKVRTAMPWSRHGTRPTRPTLRQASDGAQIPELE